MADLKVGVIGTGFIELAHVDALRLLGIEVAAVADIGWHWLDLTKFIAGLHIEAVFADLATFLKTRQ